VLIEAVRESCVTQGQLEDPSGHLRVEGPDGSGEVDGTHDLVKRVVGDLEVASSNSGRIAGQSLAQPEEGALAGAGGLIP